ARPARLAPRDSAHRLALYRATLRQPYQPRGRGAPEAAGAPAGARMKRLILGLVLLWPVAALAQGYEARPEVRAFIDEMAARHGFLPEELRAVFAEAQRVEPVLQSIQPPQPPSWADFRAQFVNEKRVAAGLD